eukprot:scaffold17483_cov52-Phaeocystis_antarctica.AAC.2
MPRLGTVKPCQIQKKLPSRKPVLTAVSDVHTGFAEMFGGAICRAPVASQRRPSGPGDHGRAKYIRVGALGVGWTRRQGF